MADCYGTPPGPEGRAFNAFLAIAATIIFLAVALKPLYENLH